MIVSLFSYELLDDFPLFCCGYNVIPLLYLPFKMFYCVVFAGLYAAGRPLEDADSRTIFISNVIFHTGVLLG